MPNHATLGISRNKVAMDPRYRLFATDLYGSGTVYHTCWVEDADAYFKSATDT
jgi:hypothetical protein